MHRYWHNIRMIVRMLLMALFDECLPTTVKEILTMTSSLRNLVITALVVLASCASHADDAPKQKSGPIVPKETIALLNGRDLSCWYTWLTDHKHKDPNGVFSIQPDGTLRISGDGFGGLITHREYANYYLVMEYRWGTATWRNRKESARDGGLLLHCQGPDGNFGGSKDAPGPWMTSVECQIIEGGVGDILVLQGTDAQGKTMHAEATCEVTRDRDEEPVWTAGGEKQRFTSGRINWFGRDPDWKDVLGFRGAKDVESPGQEWTKLECFCSGSTLVYRVNGVIVNRATKVAPAQGKILLQTEGAEMFVRQLELRPLPSPLP